MPEWIHERAKHILAKNPDMPKRIAFASATQQSHAVGKTPKGYGTPAGKREAKAKFDKPKKQYVKSPNPGKLKTQRLPGKAKMKWTGEKLVPKKKTSSPMFHGFAEGLEKAAYDPSRLASLQGALKKAHGWKGGKGTPLTDAENAALNQASGKEELGLSRQITSTIRSHAPAIRKAHMAKSASGDIAGIPVGLRAPLVDEAAAMLSGFSEEFGKSAKYLHSQVGKPKLREQRADSPNPKFRVKQSYATGWGPTGGVVRFPQASMIPAFRAPQVKTGGPPSEKKGKEKRSFYFGIPPLDMKGISAKDKSLLKKHLPGKKNYDELDLEDARGEEEKAKMSQATPAARLAASQQVGTNVKKSGQGPSIAQQSKPIGFGKPLPGVSKEPVTGR